MKGGNAYITEEEKYCLFLNGQTGTNVDGDNEVQSEYCLGERKPDSFIFQTGGLTGMCM